MAYPFVTAFVVLPTASSGSVMLLISSGRSAISAIPPALSVIGPYESIATTIPVIESMDTADKAIAKRPPMAAFSPPPKPPPRLYAQ